MSADAASVDEGDDAVFTVTLSGGTRAADVVVDYTVSGAGGATAGDDYTAPSPTEADDREWGDEREDHG